MAEILIRQAVTPDIELLSRFDHTIKTDRVWQMSQNVDDDRIITTFNENHLPREMRLTYPKSPDSLLDRWKHYSNVFVACVGNVPVGYVAIATTFMPELLWVKDLVVDEAWRRKAVATTLLQAVTDWGSQRHFVRMMIEMSSKNYPSICLAKKCGFDYAGFNDNYFNNSDIALFFSRYLK